MKLSILSETDWEKRKKLRASQIGDSESLSKLRAAQRRSRPLGYKSEKLKSFPKHNPRKGLQYIEANFIWNPREIHREQAIFNAIEAIRHHGSEVYDLEIINEMGHNEISLANPRNNVWTIVNIAVDPDWIEQIAWDGYAALEGNRVEIFIEYYL